MKKTSFFTLIFILILYSNINVWAQGSYNTFFNGPEDTRFEHLFEDVNDKFIAVYKDLLKENKKISTTRVYSFSNTSISDTVQWELNLQRQDTALSIRNIILVNNDKYFVVGGGVCYDSTYEITNRFDWAMKLDQDHNLLWESKYQWPSYSGSNYLNGGWIRVLQLDTGGYLLARTLTDYTPQPSTVMQLLLLNQYGDSITTKLYEPYLSGYIHDITYNHDSSEYMLHHGEGGGIPGCSGGRVFFLDKESLDTTRSICYKTTGSNPETIGLPYNVAWTDDNHLIVSGRGFIFSSHYLATWKYDTNYQLVNTSYLTHPDTIIYGGWSQTMDINNNGEICVAGSFDWIGSWFPARYNWAYIAKLDEDLNLLQEKYFGGDAAYNVFSIVATTDGGTAIGGYRYDYQTNNPEEGDAFIIKTDAGLWVSTELNVEIPVYSAIVYPNPGNNNLYLRTALKGAEFRLYDLAGRQLVLEPVNKLITEYNIAYLPLGVYVWTVTQNNIITDRGQWIKK